MLPEIEPLYPEIKKHMDAIKELYNRIEIIAEAMNSTGAFKSKLLHAWETETITRAVSGEHNFIKFKNETSKECRNGTA